MASAGVLLAAAEAGGVEAALLNRLRMKPGKVAQLAEGARTIAAQEEPIGRTLRKTLVADGLVIVSDDTVHLPE